METNPRNAAPSASATPTSPATTKEKNVSTTSTSEVSAVAGSSASTTTPSPAGEEVKKKRRQPGPKFHPERDTKKANKALEKSAKLTDATDVQAARHKVEHGVTALHQASEGIVKATADVGKAHAELALWMPAILQVLRVVKLMLREVIAGGRDFYDMWTVKDDFKTAKAYVDHMESNDAGLEPHTAAQLRHAVGAAEPAATKLDAAKATVDEAKRTYQAVRATLAVDTQVLNSLAAVHRAQLKQKQLQAAAAPKPRPRGKGG